MTKTFSSNRLLKASALVFATSIVPLGWSAPVGQEAPAPANTPAPVNTSVPEKPSEKDAADGKSGRLPLDELRAFTEIMQRIKSAYVEEVDDKTLLDNAIQGMLSGLDPHSAYLKPDDFKELEESTSGEFGGLGIEVGMEDGFIKVIS